ncbi:MAG: branched-chain amino acid ABC transporter permease [Alphaproteobacteria bacterium]
MAPKGLALIVFLLLAAFPPLGGDYWTDQATRYVIFGLFAMSLSLVWGRAGILCFGQAMFFGGGGYVMAALTMGLAGPALASTWVGLVCAVAGAALFAAALGYFLFWGRGLSGPYLAIVTLAIAFILEQIVKSWYTLGADNGLWGVPPLDLGAFGASFELLEPAPRYYVVLAVAAAVYLALDRMLRSPFGVVLTAVKTNPERAAFFGYRVLWIKLTVFVVGAAIAALAGAMFVAIDEFASPTLIGFGLSTEVLIWVALGGKEMVLAAFLGAVAVRVMEAYFSEFLGEYWLLSLGVVFMASVVLLPRGLIATPIAAFAARWRHRRVPAAGDD